MISANDSDRSMLAPLFEGIGDSMVIGLFLKAVIVVGIGMNIHTRQKPSEPEHVLIIINKSISH